MSNAKEKMTEVIQSQPEDATYEEIMRELAFERMIERGLVDSRSERIISNEDMGCPKIDVVEILEKASMKIKVPYFDITVLRFQDQIFQRTCVLL